jgi:hypothetical protein
MSDPSNGTHDPLDEALAALKTVAADAESKSAASASWEGKATQARHDADEAKAAYDQAKAAVKTRKDALKQLLDQQYPD